MPGQLRKTIDRISARTMKRLNFKRMLGIKSVFVVRSAPSSHVPVKVLFKGLHLQILDGKTLDSYFSHVQFSFQSFLSKQLQDWTLQGYILAVLLFFVSFPFTVFYSKTCNCELCMVKLWIPTFLSPHFFQNVLLKQLQEWILDARFSSILATFSLAADWKGNFERKNWNYKGLK